MRLDLRVDFGGGWAQRPRTELFGAVGPFHRVTGGPARALLVDRGPNVTDPAR